MSIAPTCSAQSTETQLSWMDSLELRYRVDFIESAIFRDGAQLETLKAEVTVLFFNQQIAAFQATSSGSLMKELRAYNEGILIRQIRLQCYREELRVSQSAFGFL